MKIFKDSGGRDWTVAVNVDSLRRVRDLLAVDLTKLNEGEPLLIIRLTTDPLLICDVLYAICKPDADKQTVTDVDFGRAMGGDALFLGQSALLEELIDFFQKFGRPEMAKVIRAQQAVVKAAVTAAESRIDAIDVEKAVREIVGRPSGSVLESSE